MHILNRQITLKIVRGHNGDFSTIEITSKKVRGNNVEFLIIEITSKKVRENNMNFMTSEIRSKKVHGNERIFRSAKLHRKSTLNRRGNSSKFSLQRIDVISTSNQRGFGVLCPLGSSFIVTCYRVQLKLSYHYQ